MRRRPESPRRLAGRRASDLIQLPSPPESYTPEIVTVLCAVAGLGLILAAAEPDPVLEMGPSNVIEPTRHSCQLPPPELHYTAPECCGIEPLFCQWVERGRDNWVAIAKTVTEEDCRSQTPEEKATVNDLWRHCYELLHED